MPQSNNLTFNNAVIVASVSAITFLLNFVFVRITDTETFAIFSIIFSVIMLNAGLFSTVFGDIGLIFHINKNNTFKFNYCIASLICLFIFIIISSIMFLVIFKSALISSFGLYWTFLFIVVLTLLFSLRHIFYILKLNIQATYFYLLSLFLISCVIIIPSSLSSNIVQQKHLMPIIVASCLVPLFYVLIRSIHFFLLNDLKIKNVILNIKSDLKIKLNSGFLFFLTWFSSNLIWYVLAYSENLQQLGATRTFLILAGPLQLIERIFLPQYLTNLGKENNLDQKWQSLIVYWKITLPLISIVIIFMWLFSSLIFSGILNTKHIFTFWEYLVLGALVSLQVILSGFIHLIRSINSYDKIFYIYLVIPALVVACSALIDTVYINTINILSFLLLCHVFQVVILLFWVRRR